jgi:hypothetical protein
VLLAAGAVRGDKQGPAVGGDPQRKLDCRESWVLEPRGMGDSSIRRGNWKHGCWAGLPPLACVDLDRYRDYVAL